MNSLNFQSTDRVFFISGTMRSGTSLLADLLYSRLTKKPRHKNIVSSMEGMPHVRVALNTLRGLPINKQHAGDPSWVTQYAEPASEEDGGAVDPAAAVEVERNFVRGVVKQLKVLLGRISGRQLVDDVYGVKYTNIRNEFKLFQKHFPNAKLIVMARDPRDVLASNKFRQLDMPLHRSFGVIMDTLNLEAFLDQYADDKSILVVSYEALVTNTVSEINRVLEFLGVPPEDYDWASLDRGLLNNSSFGDGGNRGKISVAHEISSHESRYRKFLAPIEVQLVEFLLADWMKKRGYAPDDHGALAIDSKSLIKTYVRILAANANTSSESLYSLTANARKLGYDAEFQDALAQLTAPAKGAEKAAD